MASMRPSRASMAPRAGRMMSFVTEGVSFDSMALSGLKKTCTLMSCPTRTTAPMRKRM